ncbi:MAG: adenylate kinase family protein [Candidatus Bathyarchaeia archaeon]
MPCKVIIITGTPGVGKTTVAKALASRLGGKYISINDLVMEEKLISGWDKKRDTAIVDLERLRKKLGQILTEAEQDIILDGHYAYDAVPKNIDPTVFVLRKDPARLETVLKERGYSENKIDENLAAEALDVCLIDALKRFGPGKVDEIDTTYMDVEAVVNEILKALRGEREMKVGKVDWLGKLEEEGMLEEFLSKIKGVGACEN